MDQPIVKWSNETLVKWVRSLQSLNDKQKTKVINAINEFGSNGASGKHIHDVEKEDLADSFEINTMLAGLICEEMEKHTNTLFTKKGIKPNNNESKDNDNSENDVFSLNLQGQKGAYCRIDKLKSTYTVKYLKERYLEYYGHDLKNEAKRKGLSIYRMGTKLADENKTLSYYKIYDDTVPLDVIFRVDGGMAFDEDAYRVRKLRHKKYKQIKLSNDADCIMGYTNEDGIKRASMPCGCSFAADTMYRYMVSAFDQDNNFRSVTMKCPMPQNQCKGTSEQRKWDWGLVFVICDLNEQEKRKYSKIITNRIAGIKQCPHCKTNCERSKDLTIFRVRCNSCKNSDWCWECAKPWKGSGLTVCGNDNCTAERLNKILSKAPMINPDWSPKDEVPSIRHCPQCLTIIQYVERCVHMTCVGCGYEFCFKCLEKWQGKYDCTTVANKQIIK